jgi:hypothetical protein
MNGFLPPAGLTGLFAGTLLEVGDDEESVGLTSRSRPLCRRRIAPLLGRVDVAAAFIVLLSIGRLLRLRWTFWLSLIAFLFVVLRIPVAVLQLSGQRTPEGPPWYVIFQGVLGVVQVLIALAMVLGYRRSGAWGS